MEYTPRYPQPFTIEQAVGLDVNMITEEIARLQNSLSYLRSTQEQLKEANDESPDPEFVTAIEENEGVIGSQEERISMLKIALAEKGIPLDGHYGIDFDRHLQQPPSMHPIVSNTTPHHNATQPAPPSRVETVAAGAAPEPSESEDIEAHDDGGIDL